MLAAALVSPSGNLSAAPTILAWKLRRVVRILSGTGIRRHGCGSGATQTTHSSAGVLAAAPLEGASRWRSARGCGALPLAPGNAYLLLRQRPPPRPLLPLLP